MKLPGKSTTYKNSVIALFPAIIRILKIKDMSVSDLHKQIASDCGDYVAALDCLYALGKIELSERGMLHFVDRD